MARIAMIFPEPPPTAAAVMTELTWVIVVEAVTPS